MKPNSGAQSAGSSHPERLPRSASTLSGPRGVAELRSPGVSWALAGYGPGAGMGHGWRHGEMGLPLAGPCCGCGLHGRRVASAGRQGRVGLPRGPRAVLPTPPQMDALTWWG